MAQQEICGLEYSITPDVQACVSEALLNNYSFVVLPIIHPRFKRHHVVGNSRVGGFTRSDMLLSPQDWNVRIVGKLSAHFDVDSPSIVARQRHEDCMNEELNYCRGLGLPAIMLNVKGIETNNLARILHTYFANSHHPPMIWARVPMVCNKTHRLQINEELDNNPAAYNETWMWWSMFHERMDWDKRVGLVLEISADLPSPAILKRWFGEPIKAIVLSTSIFHTNKKGYPVLSRPHQQLVLNMMEREAQIIVSGARRANIECYVYYLHCLCRRKKNYTDDPMLSYAKGWEDYLQTPLQPLADNLDTHTYNVFEKDPIKYDQYQKAIVKALIDMQKKEIDNNNKSEKDKSNLSSENDRSDNENVVECNKTFTIMVLGAGRGPLVRATLNAADVTNSKVKVIAIEKNPCAVVVLEAQAQEVWRQSDVQVLAGDMRQLNLPEPADIIISELLGSWADNELSPECLDGAAGLLRPGGISIPKAYTSYAAPITSPRLWAAAKGVPTMGSNSQEKNLETLWVVYMQNKYDIADTKPVFTFTHPTKGIIDNEGVEAVDYRGLPLPDNRRTVTITWIAEQDSVMHGFGGYFDCSLYGDETLSIVPSTHSPGMISWFPVFIPIKTPMRVKEGDEIRATFWRCVSARRVWYEWIVQVGNKMTPLHNSNGRSSEMLL